MSHYPLPDSKNFHSKFDNKSTHLIILSNDAGMQVAITDYGARIVSIVVPDKHGDLRDVVLGYDSINGYYNSNEKYFGATIGRYANRIGNGKFVLDGKEFVLEQNNGSNCLHGGGRGMHDRVWDRQVSFQRKVDFYYVSKDGEEGFPGNLKIHVSYELTNDNELKIKYRAASDAKTVVNLTNHAYFNLNGEGNGDVLNHLVQINSDAYLPLDKNQIPTGEEKGVKDSAFDFREFCSIAQKLEMTDEQLELANGFDHTYVNKNPLNTQVASAYSEESGIKLEVFTSEPSVHFYTGNFLNPADIGKSKKAYVKNGGFCFETQHYPDSPNRPDFPSVILEKGKEFKSETTYRFTIKK